MSAVKAKKHLGQHFLTDKNIAEKIVNSLSLTAQYNQVLEVGPGMGILSDYLLKQTAYQTHLIDLDQESYNYLREKYPQLGSRLMHGDFLQLDFKHTFSQEPLAVIGNFPYNISSQILFKILDNRDQVVEVVGMFQKEVAQRCVEKPGSKEYGILSVFLQAYYHVEYLFTVKAGVFNPPPKVLSAVIRLTRNGVDKLDCEKLFWQVVKAGFNQRRKTLRNALSALINKEALKNEPILELRAERLSVADFVKLTNIISHQNG